jgi:hypothetical protein
MKWLLKSFLFQIIINLRYNDCVIEKGTYNNYRAYIVCPRLYVTVTGTYTIRVEHVEWSDK